jgi:nicotinate-nucleotide adenylyltransferase
MSRRRIGLLGGSFNPAHKGHVAISLFALKRLHLDEVWWLVSPQNPLKASDGMAPYQDRFRFAQQCAKTHNKILVTDFEKRKGVVYTIDTLRALQKSYRHVDFVWLIGEDNWGQLARWKNWPAIMRAIPIVIFRRGERPKILMAKAGRRFAHARKTLRAARFLAGLTAPAWLVLDNPLHPLSASAIRQQQAKTKE